MKAMFILSVATYLKPTPLGIFPPLWAWNHQFEGPPEGSRPCSHGIGSDPAGLVSITHGAGEAPSR